MARSKSSKERQQAASTTSKDIAEQTRAFLEDGGAIQYIKSGVSGQESIADRKKKTATS